MACHWEIFKCRQVFNCSRETFLLSRTRATGLKHSHHNLYCFILVKSLTTGGPQMCHSSGSWSEIQSPHQDLIYDQPVGKGQGNQGCTGSWGKLTELSPDTHGRSPHCQQGISAPGSAELNPNTNPAWNSGLSSLGSTRMRSKGGCAQDRLSASSSSSP